MSEPTDNGLDPREELASLVASTRALLEQYEASGADMLVAADPAVVAAFLAGHPVAPSRTPAGPRPDAGPQPAPAQVAPRAPAAAPPAGTFAPSSPRRPPEIAAPAPPRAPVREAPPQPQLTSAAGVTGGANAEGDDRRMRLALLAEEVRPCTKCPLCESRTQTVFARGNPSAEVCFVGEGPGADEDAQGEPFVGAAGQLLDKMIVAMGYRRGDVYICNIVKCRPPQNRKPEPKEIEACLPYLRDQLALVKPKVIVALGATAVAGLTGSTEGITRLRGKWKLYKGTTPIMPTFHPAYLLRTPAAKREVWSDLQEVMKHLGKPLSRGPAARGDE